MVCKVKSARVNACTVQTGDQHLIQAGLELPGNSRLQNLCHYVFAGSPISEKKNLPIVFSYEIIKIFGMDL